MLHMKTNKLVSSNEDLQKGLDLAQAIILTLIPYYHPFQMSKAWQNLPMFKRIIRLDKQALHQQESRDKTQTVLSVGNKILKLI